MRLKVHFGWLAGWLAGWPAGSLKNSAEEARRDFWFFALNSCYFVGVRNVFSFLKLPTKT